ncbi:MAG: hypothetical protein HY466_05965 [Deltaproteobacteria bacterium]|nr:hypothetical protein [Deltaproteobacteria bacterium]
MGDTSKTNTRVAEFSCLNQANFQWSSFTYPVSIESIPNEPRARTEDRFKRAAEIELFGIQARQDIAGCYDHQFKRVLPMPPNPFEYGVKQVDLEEETASLGSKASKCLNVVFTWPHWEDKEDYYCYKDERDVAWLCRHAYPGACALRTAFFSEEQRVCVEYTKQEFKDCSLKEYLLQAFTFSSSGVWGKCVVDSPYEVCVEKKGEFSLRPEEQQPAQLSLPDSRSKREEVRIKAVKTSLNQSSIVRFLDLRSSDLFEFLKRKK